MTHNANTPALRLAVSAGDTMTELKYYRRKICRYKTSAFRYIAIPHVDGKPSMVREARRKGPGLSIECVSCVPAAMPGCHAKSVTISVKEFNRHFVPCDRSEAIACRPGFIEWENKNLQKCIDGKDDSCNNPPI